MNVLELYEQTLTQRHSDIKIAGSRVPVKSTDGRGNEYLNATRKRPEITEVSSEP